MDTQRHVLGALLYNKPRAERLKKARVLPLGVTKVHLRPLKG
jgi:hypothetical protein